MHPFYTRTIKLLRFRRSSFLVFLVIFCLEVVIALFFHDRLIRHFVGDVLVVVLISYFLRSFLAIPIRLLALGTLILACLVELTQYFNMIDRLGWRDSPMAHLIIGSTFDWADLIAYLLGAGLTLVIANWGRNCAQ